MKGWAVYRLEILAYLNVLSSSSEFGRLFKTTTANEEGRKKKEKGTEGEERKIVQAVKSKLRFEAIFVRHHDAAATQVTPSLDVNQLYKRHV